jgi:colanic acid biosynthesis glycosyl transferase WcaI
MSQKFLLISQVFYPDQVSTANLFTNLCSILAEDNIQVEVWAAHPSYTKSERQPEKLVYKNINIRFLPSTNFSKRSYAGRFINELTFTVSVSFNLLFSKEQSPVWTHTTPTFLGIFLSRICSLKKRKFVYVLLDIFPEGLIRLGKVSGKNIIIRFWQWLFINTLRKSEKVIVIGRDTRELVVRMCAECNEKTEYIPLWQDDNLIVPLDFETNRFVIGQRISDKFVVQYSGNMGLWNEIRTLGKAIKRNIEDVEFIFVGGGLRKKELFDEFSIEEQKNIKMFPFQPNEIFNDIITASHVHLVTLKEGLEGIAVPSKIYGILAAGRPVIAMVPSNSEIAYLVNEENCGFVLDPTDLDGLISVIRLLKSDKELTRQFGENSRRAFENKYTTRIIAERYKSVLKQLIAR